MSKLDFAAKAFIAVAPFETDIYDVNLDETRPMHVIGYDVALVQRNRFTDQISHAIPISEQHSVMIAYRLADATFQSINIRTDNLKKEISA